MSNVISNVTSKVINKDNNEIKDLPILYSLRNCPYAMRGRLAIYKSKQPVLLRDLVLSNKPAEMLAASPKGTVPVVVLPDGLVIEESLDVMLWALQRSDPNDLLHHNLGTVDNTLSVSYLEEMLMLIDEFDTDFKRALEAYKCAKRYQEANVDECRAICEKYITRLELKLTDHEFLMSNQESLLDIALMPFIRQFARVERQWYLQSPYPKVRQWLNNYLQSPVFTKVMAKHPLWIDNHEVVLFGG
ncbi:glutathione S-transferase [Colwellia echini]|uniref:Glutathione S-transferase n=1 Tax=Colwellia echini TaxID=1982103 RepID=A0ABY3MXP9_9GAMM|nr:glutathione S-transferase [Colwellia echini]TYK65983.1 glutathione S-transferase [Colwellia echini]